MATVGQASAAPHLDLCAYSETLEPASMTIAESYKCTLFFTFIFKKNIIQYNTIQNYTKHVGVIASNPSRASHLNDAGQHRVDRVELLALLLDLVLHLLAAAAHRLEFGGEVLALEELELEARQPLHVLVALRRFLRAPTINSIR